MTEQSMIERVARRLADVHFRRKQHAGACTQDERVAFLVETNWRNHEPDARAAIAAMREHLAEQNSCFADCQECAVHQDIDEALK